MQTRTDNRLTPTQWLICGIAAIGFAFDIYEILVLPLIVRPALLELTGAAPGSPEFQMWVGRLFYIPAFAGGIFGLLGGYLTDRFGRRRVLTYSILIYGLSAFASGFVRSIEMLLVMRCLVFVGVCVEFVAAVAWLAELFPEPKSRERVLGYTQAFSSFGGLLVATANGLAVSYYASLPAIDAFGFAAQNPHAPWRYTVMSGVIPAIPLILIRPFLPESPIWAEKKHAGTLKRPSVAALFSPEFRRTTIVTTVMFAMSYGAAFGAIQQIPQIVPGLPEVREAVQPVAVGAQFGARLRAAQHQHRKQRDRLRRQPERAPGVVLVARDARAARLEHEAQRLQRVDGDLHVRLARREHRVARSLLVAAERQRVERQRVAVRHGVLLLDQHAERACLQQRQGPHRPPPAAGPPEGGRHPRGESSCAADRRGLVITRSRRRPG